MFCINCGSRLQDEAKFCTICGAAQPLIDTASDVPPAAPATVQKGSVPASGQYDPANYQPDHSYTPQPAKKSGKGKLVLIILLIVLLVGAGIGVAIFAANGGFDKGPSLSTAAQYLEDEDYDSAIDEYKAIIEEDPQNAQAYIGLAKAYLADGNEKKTIKTLQEALDVVEDEDAIKEIEDFLDKFTTEPAFPDPDVTTKLPESAEPEPPVVLFDISTVSGEWYCEEIYIGNDDRSTPINMIIEGDLVTLISAENTINAAPEEYSADGFMLLYEDVEYTFSYYEDADIMIMVAVNIHDTDTVTTATFIRGQTDLTADNDNGKVLNIWSYNEEFMHVVENYYAGYEDGYIGDVRVEWHTYPMYDNEYLDRLNVALLSADAPKDERVDLFIMEPDYIYNYVNSPFTLPIYELGITEDNTAQMYPYTKQIGTDEQDVLKAVSWQATPGVFAYRRSIAKAVLGTDDPAAVQAHVADWSSFVLTAEQMKSQGYSMLSGRSDALRVFLQNRSEGWVNDRAELVISDEIIIWLAQTKLFADNGYDNANSLWTNGWINDQAASGNVFGFFLPSWYVSGGVLDMNSADAYGDWAICCGPDAYNWGSAYLLAAEGSDNRALVGDIMYQLTCCEDVMYEMGTASDNFDYANNMAAMARAAADPANGSAMLSGQNPYEIYHENALSIDLSNITYYDLMLSDMLEANFEPYFNGTLSFDEALENFITAAAVKYPELTFIDSDGSATQESSDAPEE